MSNSDQKDSNISISGSSDPNRNVANSSAAQPRGRGSAASSPARTRTPQADDSDQDLPDYERDSKVDAVLAAAVANHLFVNQVPPISVSPLPETKVPEIKNHPLFSQFPPTPPSPPDIKEFVPYGSTRNLVPSYFQECNMCFEFAFTESTGAMCSTLGCAQKLCHRCSVKNNPRIVCPFCKNKTMKSAALFAPAPSVDPNAMDAMRAEQLNILTELKGTKPYAIVRTNLQKQIQMFQAKVYEAHKYKMQCPQDPQASVYVSSAENSLGLAMREYLPKIELITKFLKLESALNKTGKAVASDQKMYDALMERTKKRLETERVARTGFDYNTLLQTVDDPNDDNSGDGFDHGVYVGNMGADR